MELEHFGISYRNAVGIWPYGETTFGGGDGHGDGNGFGHGSLFYSSFEVDDGDGLGYGRYSGGHPDGDGYSDGHGYGDGNGSGDADYY